MQPMISVVMPVYNVQNYIEDSVRSICQQTYQNFELILVDDGSTDESIRRAEALLNNTSVRYQTIHQENRGLSGARNTGIMAAAGKWIICIDSDDTIHPQTLEFLSQYIFDETVDAIAFQFKRVTSIPEEYDTLRECGVRRYSQQEFAQNFFGRKLQLAVPTLLIRRELFFDQGILYDETCKFSEDQLFIWALIPKVRTLLFLEKEMYYYLNRSGSIMTSSGIDKIMTGYSRFYEMHQSIHVMTCLNQLGIDATMILPRWVFGTLHSTAKQMNLTDFICLKRKIARNRVLLELRNFPDKRVSFLAWIAECFPRLFFVLAKCI